MRRGGGGAIFFGVTGEARRTLRRVRTCRVARRTGHGCVFTREWEFRGVVVECRAEPVRGGVAGLAILPEPRGGVIGTGGGGVFIQMARRTNDRERSVLIIHMARRASHRRVFARQGKPGGVVVESSA